jgi:hypothetical protein
MNESNERDDGNVEFSMNDINIADTNKFTLVKSVIGKQHSPIREIEIQLEDQ